MRSRILISIMLLSLCGCFSKPEPKHMEAPSPVEVTPSLKIYKAPEPVNGPVTLEEAMARALKYRLSSDINKISKALEMSSVDSDEYESLSHFAQMAGYEDFPSPWEAKANVLSSLKISSIGTQYGLSGEIASMWNILDMGMIYAARAWFPAKKDIMGDMIYKKAAFNIMQKTRYLYYKAVSAMSVAGEVNILLDKARSALNISRKANGSGALYQKKELDERKRLIEYTRFLWALARKLNQAGTELTSYINLPSGASFKLVTPAWDSPRLPRLKKSPDSLENLALIHRPEPDLEGRIAKGGIYEVRGAILALRPKLDFDSGFGTGSDAMTYDKSWWEAGLRVADRIYELYSVPVSEQSHKSHQAYNRQIALNMGIVSQLHLALQRYFLSLEEYKLSRMDYEVSEKLVVKNIVDSLPGKSAEIGKAVESLIAKIRYHRAFTELENAGVRIYNSIGIDPIPSKMESASLASLTSSLIKTRARWDALLKEAQASYYPDAKNIPTIAFKKSFSRTHKPVPGKIEEKDLKQSKKFPHVSSPKFKKPVSYVAKAQKSKNVPTRKTIVTNANSAIQKGRFAAKEIEIFRDVVNIYFEPSVKSKVKGQGLIGERYKLLGWSSKGWLKVEMTDGSFGWVPTRYVRPVEKTRHYAHEPVKDIYKAKEKPASKKTVKKAAIIISTIKRANVRSGPGLNYTVKYIEETGKRFTVRGKAGEWFKIRTKDSTDGWLHESVVKVISGN